MLAFLKKKHREKTEEEREKAAESKAKQLWLSVKFLGSAKVRDAIVEASNKEYSKMYKDMKKEKSNTPITADTMVARTNRGVIRVGEELGLSIETFLAMAQDAIDKARE